MKLRAFRPDDEAALAELWYQSWRSVGLEQPAVTRRDLSERLVRERDGRWRLTLADADGSLSGFLALARSERRLDQLFVAPQAQGRGVGRALFDHAKLCLPTGFWLKTQAANVRARQFYEARGMVVDRVETDPAGDRVVFVYAAPHSLPDLGRGPAGASARRRPARDLDAI